MPKISQLPTTTTVSDPDVLPIVQSGTTKRILYTDFTDQVTTDVLAAVNTQVTAAENAASAAAISATAAQTAETNAELAETNAEAAQTAAQTAQTNAELAETSAEGHAASAATYASTAAINANAYDTIAAGLAATASGSSFIVKANGSDALMRPTLYKDNAGVQEEILALLPATEYDTLRQQLAGTGVMTDKGPLVVPVVQENITNASAVSYTATYESTGTRINQTTASLLAVYQTKINPGGKRTKITQTVTITTASSAVGFGLSFGSDATRRTIYYRGDGNLYSMLGEDASTSTVVTGLSTFTSGDTLTLIYELKDDGVLKVGARKGTGKTSWWGTSAVTLGRVDIAVYGAGNAVHSFDISSLSALDDEETDATVNDSGITTAQRSQINALAGVLDILAVSTPADITATLPTNFAVYKKFNPRTFTGIREFFTSIELQPPVSLYDPKNAIVYVDIATGNDTNAGTASAPLKTLPAAQAAVRACPYATIMVKGGNYYGHTQALDTVTYGFQNNTIQIISWDGQPVYNSPHMGVGSGTALTWTLGSSNTYSADCSAMSYFTSFGCSGVLDSSASQQNSDGDYAFLTAATSLANCEATPGSYWRDAAAPSTIHVHCADNRAPDADIRVFAAQWGSGSFGSNANNSTFYLEGIRFEGGNTVWNIAPTTTQTITGYAKDCWFRHSMNSDAYKWVACGTSVLQRCVVAKAYTDNISYTKFSTGPACVAVEIDVTSRHAGRTTGSTNQGSTMHTGGTTVRVNGEYFGNQHSNITDVAAARMWLLGVNAHDPSVANGVSNIGIGTSTGDTGTIAYMDTCTTTGLATDLIVGNSCTAYYYDHVANSGTTPVKTGGGTLTTYTP